MLVIKVGMSLVGMIVHTWLVEHELCVVRT